MGQSQREGDSVIRWKSQDAWTRVVVREALEARAAVLVGDIRIYAKKPARPDDAERRVHWCGRAFFAGSRLAVIGRLLLDLREAGRLLLREADK